MAAATPSQSIAILARHARDEVAPLRLQELCTDAERVNSLVEVHRRAAGAVSRYERAAARLAEVRAVRRAAAAGTAAAAAAAAGGDAGLPSPYYPSVGSVDTSDHASRLLLVDLSRHRMTVDTVNHLLRLARSRDVRGFVRNLAWGWNDRTDPVVPARGREGSGGSGGGGAPLAPDLSGTGTGHNPPPQRPDQRPEGEQRSRRARFAAQPRPGQGRSVSFDGDDGSAGGGGQQQQQPPSSRTSPSMHLALRAPAGAGLEMLLPDGTNALDVVHGGWDRILRLSDSVRRGKRRGASGRALRDVVVVGGGVPVAALRFLYDALRRDPDAAKAASDGLGQAEFYHPQGGGGGGIKTAASDVGRHVAGRAGGMVGGIVEAAAGGGGVGPGGAKRRRMRFVPSVDPSAALEAVAGLRPESTLVVTIGGGGRGSEATGQEATRTLKRWLLAGLGWNRDADQVLEQHTLMVTGSDRAAAGAAGPAENVFVMPEFARCEAFATLTAAGLVPLSIVFGWDTVERILAGAHDMDTHFVETNPRHNLPILLALADLWNDAFLGSSGRIVSPFSDVFASYPAFLAAIESQTYGRGSRSGEMGGRKSGATALGSARGSRSDASALVIDGGLCGAYDRVVYQGGRPIPSELIVSMDTQAASPAAAETLGPEGAEQATTAHDALVCSFFAHADVLAFGSGGSRDADGRPSLASMSSASTDTYSPRSIAEGVTEGDDLAEGNRPSTLIVCGSCDAFTCGQLVALAEHRAAVAARLWDVDPFAFSFANGTSLRAMETERVKEKLHHLYEKLDRGEQEGDDDDSILSQGTKLNLATSTVLWHYANRTRDQNMYVVPGK